MQHISHTTEEFLSDDKRIGVYLEVVDGKISSVGLSKKNGPKVEFLPSDLEALASVITGAQAYAETRNTGPILPPPLTLEQVG